jgi:hypothetical protein
MHTSPITPVATKLVTNLLAGLIARRACATSDLRLACNWLSGAHQLALAIGDPGAVALLYEAETSLRNIADRYGDELEVLAWLGNLLERISGQGQEESISRQAPKYSEARQ